MPDVRTDRLIPKQVLRRVLSYLDRYGWDVTEDEATWRVYQQRQMAREYEDDSWREPATPLDGSGARRKENQHGS